MRFVRDEQEDDRRAFDGIGYRPGVEAVLDRGLPVFVGTVAHDGRDAAVAKVGGEGLPLNSVADDGDDLVLDVVQTRVLLDVHARPLSRNEVVQVLTMKSLSAGIGRA